MKVSAAGATNPAKRVSLRELARQLGLSPTTVSLVLNESPGSEAIPPATQQRIRDTAKRLSYRPNFLARSLRAQRTFAVGVVVPELSDGYAALVMAGIEEVLQQRGYLCFTASHRHSPQRIEAVPRLLCERRVDGLILVDTPIPSELPPLPVAAVSGSVPAGCGTAAAITRVVLDHDAAAALGIGHLLSLGHRRIAVIKGQSFSSDTETRWRAILRAARAQGHPIDPQLTVQLEGESPSPETGYAAAQTLLRRGHPFTALFAFSDVSAFGAIRALQEHGRQVPQCVSVVGFDDVWGAAYHIPALTTIRQPLRRMGAIAAEQLLARVERSEESTGATAQGLHVVEPELIIRESTAAVKVASHS